MSPIPVVMWVNMVDPKRINRYLFRLFFLFPIRIYSLSSAGAITSWRLANNCFLIKTAIVSPTTRPP